MPIRQAARYKGLRPCGVLQMANKILIEKDIPIPMRDGTVLKGDLYRPDGPERLPVLLNRTPYGKSGAMLRQAMDSVRAALISRPRSHPSTYSIARSSPSSPKSWNS